MTLKKSYLSDYEEIDGGFVAFGGDPKGGKITGKGKISTGRKPALSFMRPFGCLVTILNTIDHLGKFDGKADEGLLVGYSTNSKAFRVFSSRTRIVEENPHVKFSEETSNIARNGPNWLFDIDALTKSMNSETVIAGNQSNGIAGIKECENAGKAREETIAGKDYILLPFLTQDSPFSSSLKDSPNAGFKPSGEEEKKDAKDPENEDSEVPNTKEPRVNQEQDENVNSTNNINTISPTVNVADIENNVVDENIVYGCDDDPNMPNLEEIMDVKSAFLYSKIEEEVYVCQPPGFEDPEFPNKVYKVIKALYETLSTYLLDNGFQRGQIDKTLSTKKSLCIEFEKLMHKKFQMSSMSELTFFLGLQVTQKYDGIFISQDNFLDKKQKFHNRSCQFLGGRRLISWQCKKQTIVANSTTKAEYVVASSCCGQVLWIQNQMLDYGYNFMNTKIFIDNESTICIVKNPLFHSKTKHIEIRQHFIRDSYEKRLIQVIKIHTDHNVADLLIKAFDVSRFQYLIAIDENVIKEWEDKMERAATTASSLEAYTMASAIICLATNKNFNFSKYIFDNMVKNLEGGVKFLMYPRFVQVFLDKQDEGMSRHKGIYVIPSHTKKVFANMKRPGNGFSGKVTPLFETMMVQATEDIGEDSADPTDSHSTPIVGISDLMITKLHMHK
ncbi:putative ribonuclease H-like domain-containing protein [Tanacetum coccineum]